MRRGKARICWPPGQRGHPERTSSFFGGISISPVPAAWSSTASHTASSVGVPVGWSSDIGTEAVQIVLHTNADRAFASTCSSTFVPLRMKPLWKKATMWVFVVGQTAGPRDVLAHAGGRRGEPVAEE